MHIPDGYLSPQTTIPALIVMSAIWYLAFRKVKLTQNQQSIPTIALCAAFSFVIMMFNIPVAGGSSAHAVGAVLVAILVGPWAAILAVSTTLIIQALIFGDGGILAIGVNCFNMAFLMPVCGYAIYKLISGTSELGSRRNLIATFIASYIGINLAAFAAAVEMGIQPLLFTSPNGTPLYGFYPLGVTIPAMMFVHMLFAGILDGLISALALGYVVKFAPHLLNPVTKATNEVVASSWMSRNKTLIITAVLVICLTPLGLLPSGSAYGEWGLDEVKQLIGYIPSGMAKTADLWHAILPDYSLPVLGESALSQSLGYILSALVGISLIAGLIIITHRLTKNSYSKN
jgi:cobalt/nickel transport system permease protein